jgi:MFS transporter, DHA1 family, tetracycline resistance protein
MSASTTAGTASAEEKLDFKRIFPIFVVVLVDLLGLTVIIPLLPLYAATFRASPLTIGLLGAAYPTMQFIAAPILGRLSDRYGRKPILVISQIGTLLGFMVLGFANGLWMLFVSRIVDGFSGGNIATAQAMIADSTTERTRTQGLGLIGAAFGLGFIVGPIIAFASLALSGENYRIPAFIAAGLSALSVLLSMFWLRETHDPVQRSAGGVGSAFIPGALLRWLATPKIGLLLALMFTQQFAFGGFEQFLPLFNLSRLGLNGSGNAAVFVYVGLIVVAIQGGLIGRWSRRWGERKLIYVGLATLALGLALTALTPAQATPWYSRAAAERELGASGAVVLPDDTNNSWLGLAWLLTAMVPASIGGGVLSPSINSLLTRRVAPQQRGEILGASAAAFSAANVLAPLAGGALFQAAGASAPFWLWAAVLMALLALALRAWGAEPGGSDSAHSPTIRALLLRNEPQDPIVGGHVMQDDGNAEDPAGPDRSDIVQRPDREGEQGQLQRQTEHPRHHNRR